MKPNMIFVTNISNRVYWIKSSINSCSRCTVNKKWKMPFTLVTYNQFLQFFRDHTAPKEQNVRYSVGFEITAICVVNIRKHCSVYGLTCYRISLERSFLFQARLLMHLQIPNSDAVETKVHYIICIR